MNTKKIIIILNSFIKFKENNNVICIIIMEMFVKMLQHTKLSGNNFPNYQKQKKYE